MHTLWGVGLTDEHLRAIGLVAVRWSTFESELSSIIWHIANLRALRGYAVTAHLSERARVDMCNALADNTFGWSPVAAELRSHLNHVVSNIYPKRNAVVHATWGYSPEQGKSDTLPVKARGEIKLGPRKAYAATDIEAIAVEIEEAVAKLEAIRRKITELLPTLSNWP